MEQPINETENWPSGVKPISFADTNHLGVGIDGRLYWHGRPVKTEQRLVLSLTQKIIAAVTALAIILGGLGGLVQGLDAAHDLSCQFHWSSTGCQK